jgi:putative transposase
MCKVLQLPRSTYYYEGVDCPLEDPITSAIIDIFNHNRRVYGTRKIKVELKKQGMIISRRRIGRIMKENGLVSKYTVAQFKPQPTACNNAKHTNELNRQFNQQEERVAVVSDLTYIRVNQKWHYICVFIDLYNREIIGYSVGSNKDASLVYRAFASIKGDLRKIQLFHTDRGNEFKNNLMDQALDTFHIKRSLSMKGCPYDNAVAEATFKLIKTELVKGNTFVSLADLNRELHDYVHWFNKIRTHGSLNYLSPIDYKLVNLKKTV